MSRRYVQVNLFEPPTKKLKDGRIIDMRHIQGIDPDFRYSPKQVAEILSVSIFVVLDLCERKNALHPQKIDIRHFADFKENRNYTTIELARKFNCSTTLIYKMRLMGIFEQVKINSYHRIPGWSIIDYIKQNAARVPATNRLDFVEVNSLIRIPGWALIDYIERNCSDL